jgi:hypothetical protein
MTPSERAFLESRGWQMSQPVDICSLDHSESEPGYLKVVTTGGEQWEIILCAADALVLEEGAWEGDYTGAPTPPDSRAADWPWMPVVQAAAG